MSNASAAADPPSVVPRQPAIAPFIVAAVGDVARPRGVLAPSRALNHLPGESGIIAGVKTVLGIRRRGVAYQIDQCRRFGPIHRSQLGPLPFVGVTDPEAMMNIARNEDRAWSAALPWSALFKGINPSSATLDALTMLDFEMHREARKLLQPGFSPAATAAYLEIAQAAFEPDVDSWIAAGRVDFKGAIRRLLANVSARVFVGIDDAREGEKLDRALIDFWVAPFVLVRNRWLSPTQRRAMRGYAHLRNLLRPLVPVRRARPGPDLFSRLCAEASGPAWLDDDAIVRLFIGVLAAAFDTTSSGLASMAHLLATHQDWQDRLRDEALAVGRGRVTYEDAKRLETIERAWKETLRLFPVAMSLPRMALRDVALGPWPIPAGTFVLGLLGPILRDPNWWTDPERFDPDRFSETRAEDRKHKGLFLPFGGGAHACIGLHLAGVEVKGFWHAMLTRCRFRHARGHEAGHTFTPLGTVSGDVRLVVERLA